SARAARRARADADEGGGRERGAARIGGSGTAARAVGELAKGGGADRRGRADARCRRRAGGRRLLPPRDSSVRRVRARALPARTRARQARSARRGAQGIHPRAATQSRARAAAVRRGAAGQFLNSTTPNAQLTPKAIPRTPKPRRERGMVRIELG